MIFSTTIAILLIQPMNPPERILFESQFQGKDPLAAWTIEHGSPECTGWGIKAIDTVSLMPPITVPAGNSYSVEARLRVRPGTGGWAGLLIGVPTSSPTDPSVRAEGQGIVFLYFPGGEEFLLHERPTNGRLLHIPPTVGMASLKDRDAEGYQPLGLRIEVHRPHPPHRAFLRLYFNGFFLGEHLAGGSEVNWNGFHRVALATTGSMEAIWEEVRVTTLSRDSYPLYSPKWNDLAPTALFPKNPPPAPRIDYLEIDRLTLEDYFTAVVLQGLVNRTQPRIFTNAAFYEVTNIEPGWGHLVEESGRELVRDQTLDEMLIRYRHELDGVVLYEPGWANSPSHKELINVVQNVCAVRKAVPLSLERHKALEDRLGLKVVFDARGRWKDGKDGLDWALREIWPECYPHAMAHLQVYREGMPSRDYLVSHRIFTFMSAAYEGTLEEYHSYTEILSRSTVGTPILGMSYLPRMGGEPRCYFSENVIFDLAGELGKFFIYTMHCGNLSYHSGIRDIPRQKDSPPTPELDPQKAYVVLLTSDGDNAAWSMNLRLRAWMDDYRGGVPVAHTFAPSLLYLCPDVCEWYFRTATPMDRFIVSGHGFGNSGYRYVAEKMGGRLLDSARESTRRRFFAQMDASLAALGTTCLNPLGFMPEEMAAKDAGCPRLRLILAGYNHAPTPPLLEKMGKSWVMTAFSGHPGGNPEQAAQAYADRIAEAASQRPAFLYAWILGNLVIRDYSLLSMIRDRLGKDVEIVTPEQMTDLLNAWEKLSREEPYDRQDRGPGTD